MKNTKQLTLSAMIAALYVILTFVSNLFGLANGVIQVRLSEALTILPFFTPAAIPGLFVGCILSNILTGCVLWDIVLGSIATLLGAFGTYFLRKFRWAASIPPILSNTLIIPFVLSYIYNFEGSIWYFIITVGIGEIISCGFIGMILLSFLNKHAKYLFKSN